MRTITRIKIKAINYLLNNYIFSHIATRQWHVSQFDFISDQGLRERLADEFISARYIYKCLTAVQAKDWLQRAQVRVQVLMYASIYEAALHHILFEDLKDHYKVKELLQRQTLITIDIPQIKLDILQSALEHDGKKIITTYSGTKKESSTQVRFDRKAECAYEIGIIGLELKNDLIEIYEARNSIHIHAEMRKGLNYELALSKKSYRRMKLFTDQCNNFLKCKSPP